MWTQAMKASLKFTFSHRTSGPNCFFLSVESRVISSLSAFHLSLVVLEVPHSKLELSGLVSEVIDGLSEEGDAGETTFLVLKTAG
uniref:Uncharacterized protein n=1 Tax=Anguilla anguilla TaxID=7936 RepID=A0A0E9U734_ANGAN